MNTIQRKGRLFADMTYKIGIVEYRQTSHKDAMQNVRLATTEQQAAYEEFHPAVSEMHINVRKLQLEIGKLKDAMN